MPTLQETKPWKSVNDVQLTTNHASLVQLIKGIVTNSSRILNIDETGCSSGKITSPYTSIGKYMRYREAQDLHFPEFTCDNRITWKLQLFKMRM